MHRSKFGFTLAATLAVALAVNNAHAQSLTTLFSFNGQYGNGGNPFGNVTLSANGSTLYGMSQMGGPGGNGAIFSVPVTGGAPTVIASFNGNDGNQPQGSLTLVGSTLYGMTLSGGPGASGNVVGNGAIFSVPATGGTPHDLYGFPSATTTAGGAPWGSLTISANGSTFYGMASSWGAHNDGVIFSIPVAGGTPTILASFNGTDGAAPFGGLTLIGSTLYGMTSNGGANNDGAIFSIPITGGTPTVLASFNGTDGAHPNGDLTLVGSTFYGMTSSGGANGGGTIFSIPATGGTPTDLSSFTGRPYSGPLGSLTLNAAGSAFYGASPSGGLHGDGMIFSIALAGSAPNVLYSFSGADGLGPINSLTLSADGSTLYGMTQDGGAHNQGTVFALVLPEPSSVLLLGMGAIAFAAMALRRKARSRAA